MSKKNWEVDFTYTSNGKMQVIADTEEEAMRLCEEYCELNGMPHESEAVQYYGGECEAEYINEVKP